MRKKLTNKLIDSYIRLDDHSRAVLAGFSEHFAGCTIEWISTEEAEKRKEGMIPANGTKEISAQCTHRDGKTMNQTKKGRDAVSAQPRLFKENYE